MNEKLYQKSRTWNCEWRFKMPGFFFFLAKEKYLKFGEEYMHMFAVAFIYIKK